MAGTSHNAPNKIRRHVSVAMDPELATAVEAFIEGHGHTIGDGIRVLLKMALALDPKTVLSESERRRAFKETQFWMQQRVESFFNESAALMKSANAELRIEQQNFENGAHR